MKLLSKTWQSQSCRTGMGTEVDIHAKEMNVSMTTLSVKKTTGHPLSWPRRKRNVACKAVPRKSRWTHL